MKKPNKFTIGAIIGLAMLAIGFFGPAAAISFTWQNKTDALNTASIRLNEDGIDFAVGEVHSPSIIEVTVDYAYFLNFTRTHDIYKVYEIKASSGFLALLDQTYGLEYRPKYDVKNWWIW